jgi:hypothetical protein
MALALTFGSQHMRMQTRTALGVPPLEGSTIMKNQIQVVEKRSTLRFPCAGVAGVQQVIEHCFQPTFI